MSFFGCGASALPELLQAIQLRITVGEAGGFLKWKDMDALTRMGLLKDIMEKNIKNLNCVYKYKKNQDLIQNLREYYSINLLDDEAVMNLEEKLIPLAVIGLFIKNKEKAKLGGRRRRRTKKRKSRRRRKRTKKRRRKKRSRRRRRRR